MEIARGIHIDRLVKHLFVSGLPGFGKTTAILLILLHLLRRGIPFLVIEPIKTEYRILKTLKNSGDKDLRTAVGKLKLYTPGRERISPLRFNPLKVLPGIDRDEHIENLLACFKGVTTVGGPIIPLLGEALELVYEDHPDPLRPPVMADVPGAVKRVLDMKDYSRVTSSDIETALQVRVDDLTRRIVGRVFQCRESVPGIDELLKTPSIIELDGLPVEQACLFTLFILTAVREYLRTSYTPGKGLQLAIIIEEAHSVLGRRTNALPSETNADPQAFAADYICRMLAELRALGVAMIIVDQNPSQVAPQVMKNTASKLAFRQSDKDDCEQLAGAMLLSETQTQELARLGTGEAFLMTEGYQRPRRIRGVNPYGNL